MLVFLLKYEFPEKIGVIHITVPPVPLHRVGNQQIFVHSFNKYLLNTYCALGEYSSESFHPFELHTVVREEIDNKEMHMC